MYCTLQEAYSVPSFDPAAKSKKNRSSACAPRSGGAPADSYDTYGPERGRELAAAPRAFGREDFANQSLSTPVQKQTYAALANDYKYYCDTYGVCSDAPPKPEREQAHVPEGFENFKTESTNSSNKKVRGATCGPLQPPVYEYPMKEEDRRSYNRALDTALKQTQTSTAPTRVQPRKVDMSNVGGYYDEDLEMYLQTKDMKASPPLPTMPRSADSSNSTHPYDPSSSPFAEALDKFKGTPFSGGSVSSTARSELLQGSKDTGGLWLDLLFFVLIGLLVIILCDQLVRLGVMLGMKSTAAALAPILAQLEKAQ